MLSNKKSMTTHGEIERTRPGRLVAPAQDAAHADVPCRVHISHDIDHVSMT